MAKFSITAAQDTTFEYKYLKVNDLQVNTVTCQKTGKQTVLNIEVDGEQVQDTGRFWNSLFARYGFNNAFFKYFDYSEVFSRISDRESNDRMRLCIERPSNANPRLLAVSNPSKPVVTFADLYGVLEESHSESVSYADGIVESYHLPRVGVAPFQIGADDYQNRFLLSCPVDGYGQPNVFLSMIRQKCNNGMVGYTKTWRSQISLGKGGDDSIVAINRMIDGFGNEEGYAALRQRVESAQLSWASVYEAWQLQSILWRHFTAKRIAQITAEALVPSTSVHDFYKNGRDLLSYVGNEEMMGNPIFRAYEAMTGSLLREYGIANMDAFSIKRQRTMPAKCTVYDLLNFATEVATHHAEPSAARSLQAWLGEALTQEYDLEGTREHFADFKDFHIHQKIGGGWSGSTIADAGAAVDSV